MYPAVTGHRNQDIVWEAFARNPISGSKSDSPAHRSRECLKIENAAIVGSGLPTMITRMTDRFIQLIQRNLYS